LAEYVLDQEHGVLTTREIIGVLESVEEERRHIERWLGEHA
jgi:hypothetical protein